MKNKVLAFCVKTFFMGAGYKKGRRLLPCGRFRAHIAITAA
ncbi:hypothetical protein EC900091_2091 [Escherichia coli 90.0091]|nr:hypothetical protein ECFRIK1985_1897 [Escherichia coli FRIK1985]EIN79417.1 hypothetical protein ECPA15_2013 [Escherichia coli PA15]EIO18921.1 hypothetical protein ECPA32_1827 [Escherichia coli PA32]EKH75658.1 hypothetical protein ECPA23_1847 [Escherichia coli PA23]EKI13348.1 hypothetical protein ECEC96038_1712 [Escherichia coli EC96038]EKJ65335.1 hypothetical protein EC01304_1886 [Escherichia coli 0.1304]EKV98848.1 hypothetical protein EC900091_2091 [Escherichia coli 90.0091]